MFSGAFATGVIIPWSLHCKQIREVLLPPSLVTGEIVGVFLSVFVVDIAKRLCDAPKRVLFLVADLPVLFSGVSPLVLTKNDYKSSDIFICVFFWILMTDEASYVHCKPGVRHLRGLSFSHDHGHAREDDCLGEVQAHDRSDSAGLVRGCLAAVVVGSDGRRAAAMSSSDYHVMPSSVRFVQLLLDVLHGVPLCVRLSASVVSPWECVSKPMHGASSSRRVPNRDAQQGTACRLTSEVLPHIP
jgi:hypothetical protein